MKETFKEIQALKEQKSETRKKASILRSEARRLGESARNDADEIQQLQAGVVREFLAECEPRLRHSSFEISQVSHFYGRGEPAIHNWVDASKTFHEALSELVTQKIKLLEYFKKNPDEISHSHVKVTVNATNALKPQRWSPWRVGTSKKVW